MPYKERHTLKKKRTLKNDSLIIYLGFTKFPVQSPTCPKTESTIGRSFLLSPSSSQMSSGSPTGEDRLKVLALGFGGLLMLAELHLLNDSIFFLIEPWRREHKQIISVQYTVYDVPTQKSWLSQN